MASIVLRSPSLLSGRQLSLAFSVHMTRTWIQNLAGHQPSQLSGPLQLIEAYHLELPAACTKKGRMAAWSVCAGAWKHAHF